MKEPNELTEKELLNLFSEFSGGFVRPEGETYRIELLSHMKKTWEKCQKDRTMKWAYIFRLIESCPPLIQRPPGFEWVMDEFENAFKFRCSSHQNGLQGFMVRDQQLGTTNQDFWEAWEIARGKVNKGRPEVRLKHYLRANEVGRNMSVGWMSKTEAINAQLNHEKDMTIRGEVPQSNPESNWEPTKAQRRPIFKSLEFVSKEGNWRPIVETDSPITNQDVIWELCKMIQKEIRSLGRMHTEEEDQRLGETMGIIPKYFLQPKAKEQVIRKKRVSKKDPSNKP